MTAEEVFDEIRMLGGRLEARGDRLHVEAPKGVLTPEHREALTALKSELLVLVRESRKDDELQESTRRLQAMNVLLAISEDGVLRIVRTEAEAHQVIAGGLTVYTPRDAYMYVTLSEHERRMLHGFKKRFGGTVEWSSSPEKSHQNETSHEKPASEERQA